MPERMDNPMADAIRIRLGEPGGPEREIYWELLGGQATELLPDGDHRTLEDVAFMETETGWRARVTLPPSVTLPTALRVGVSDNDLTYHTQWRTLTPPGRVLRLLAEP